MDVLFISRISLQFTCGSDEEMIVESVVFCVLVVVALKIVIKFTNGICNSNTCLVGKTAIVTGGNSGIGYETALNLASRGCRVLIADVRNAEDSIKRIIAESDNPNVRFKPLDLGSLKSVRNFAADVLETEERLDILINNAGCGGYENVYTEDGLLKVMQVNHYGHFLLTHLLLDMLKMTCRSRVIFLSSGLAFLHTIRNPDRLNMPLIALHKSLISVFHYSNSKLCNLISAQLFAQKLKPYGICCYSTHPGIVSSQLYKVSYNNFEHTDAITPLVYFIIRLYVSMFGKTPSEGAQTVLYCALSKNIENKSGQYFHDCVPFWVPSILKDELFCEKIWKNSEDLVKLRPQEKIFSL